MVFLEKISSWWLCYIVSKIWLTVVIELAKGFLRYLARKSGGQLRRELETRGNRERGSANIVFFSDFELLILVEDGKVIVAKLTCPFFGCNGQIDTRMVCQQGRCSMQMCINTMSHGKSFFKTSFKPFIVGLVEISKTT